MDQSTEVQTEDYTIIIICTCAHTYNYACILSYILSLSLSFRYYWNDDLFIRAVNAEFLYGYEYLGNTGRLVITPLTDRYYTIQYMLIHTHMYML